MSACLAMGDPEAGGIPPVFTAICLVRAGISCATGFFVSDRADVVTARHVVCKDKHEEPTTQVGNSKPLAGDTRDNGFAVVVSWLSSGRHFLFNAPADLIREDRRTDLALLRLRNPEEFPRPVSLESVTTLSLSPSMPGDFVYFDSFWRSPSKSFEVFRLEARVKQIIGITIAGLEQRILKLDVEAWPGASGSPVFSTSGKVIGVITAGRVGSGESLVRDGRWVWELFGKPQPTIQKPRVILFSSSGCIVMNRSRNDAPRKP